MTQSPIHIYLRNGEISMWVKQHIWHKWMPKTPKVYAESMAKFTGKKAAYGPTWWGMHDESPESKGYTFVGIIQDQL